MIDSSENPNTGRIKFLYFCLMLAFAILAGRLIYVVSTGDKVVISKFYNTNKNQRRGDIVDRNGIILATDLRAKSLYVSSVLVKDPKIIARKIADIFPNINYEDVLDRINSRRNFNWILIKRGVTPKEQEMIQSLKVAGLIFEDDLVRVYPQKSILAHIVGYSDTDRRGLSGVEMEYDELLAEGQNLQLAMDVRLQDILSEELANGMKKYKALAASGIIMDVTNGEIIALSSQPSFDPNHQENANRDSKFNRATYGVYELGSIFKIFTNAIAFEDNLVKMSDSFDVSNPIPYGRFTIRDDHPIKGFASVAEIFSKSSNIGTIEIAKKIGIERQKRMLEKFGLLRRVKSDFPALSRPRYPRKWREINLFTISYGHGIAITPLHMAAGVSAMVNDGILYSPSFKKLDKKPQGERVIKISTSNIMRKMLRDVVENGTGRFADAKGYEVGGKTGTAEKAEFGGYNKKKTLASFVAVFPTSKPKYLVFVSIDQANHSFNTGGMVAAPVVKNIVESISPIIGIVPKNLQ